MRKRKSRRCISIRPETYAGAELVADMFGTSISNLVEEAIKSLLLTHGIPMPDRDATLAKPRVPRRPAKPKPKPKPEPLPIHNYFTF